MITCTVCSKCKYCVSKPKIGESYKVKKVDINWTFGKAWSERFYNKIFKIESVVWKKGVRDVHFKDMDDSQTEDLPPCSLERIVRFKYKKSLWSIL